MKTFTLFKPRSLKWILLSFLLFIPKYSLMAQGTEPSLVGGVYQVASLDNLKWIAYQVNTQNNTFSGKSFQQTADIDASATSSWNSGAGWTAIGAEANGTFSGSYDGQGYTISNLYIYNPSRNYYGLWGYCANATIKNLGVTNVSINAGDDVGGLVGYMDATGTVSNCYVTGVVSSSSTGIVGGLMGEAFDATITNCHANCSISEGAKAGGLLGMLSGGSISNSYASGSITASTASYIGGLIGGIQNSAGIINSCYSSSAITINGEYAGGKSFTGGFIGYIYQNALSAVTISDCYATGSISGTNFSAGSRIGGFIGENTSTVSNCYTTVSIPSTGATTLKGAFVGENHKEGPTDPSGYGTINNNCFWNSNIYTNGCGDNTGATFSATGKTTTAMKTPSTFTGAGWDFVGETTNGSNDYWNIGAGYPYLNWCTAPDAPTIGTATAGNAQASVTFTAPSSNGGNAITGYTVTSNPGGLTGTGTSSPITVSGLTNGTTYTFTVTATNDIGTSAASASSSAVTPATVPGVPTSVLATKGNGSASVSFTAPASTGGNAITGYTVTSNPGGKTGTGTSSPITVSGLTNETTYTFTVTATNGVGTGAASAPSNSVTPSTTTGIDDAKLEGVTIYPNPVDDRLYIKGVDAGEVAIYDMGGCKVISAILENNHAVDVSGLAKGVYTVRLTTPNGNLEKKMVKK